KRTAIGEYPRFSKGWSPLKSSCGRKPFPADFDIRVPLTVNILVCIQYFAGCAWLQAWDWAISLVWCVAARSMPPPWMSNCSPRYLLLIAEHSICQPGKPTLHGDGQRMMC